MADTASEIGSAGIWGTVTALIVGGIVKVVQTVLKNRKKVVLLEAEVTRLRAQKIQLRRSLRRAQHDHLHDLQKMKRTLPPPPSQ